jgi:hypothetical protein
MFTLPIVEEVVPEGLNDDHPIHLEGIQKSDFGQLWRFMDTRFVVVSEIVGHSR